MRRNFQIYLALATAYVLAEFAMAYIDGWAFAGQVVVGHLGHTPDKFLAFWSHAGMHGDFWIINPVMAYVLAKHAESWSLRGFAIIFTIVALVGMALLVPLLKDSAEVPSAFSRDGFLTIAGGMHYLYYTVGMSTGVSYYLLSKRENVSAGEVVLITIALAIHWGLGILQPPYTVHGAIHLPAKIIAGGGWAAMIALAIRLCHFA